MSMKILIIFYNSTMFDMRVKELTQKELAQVIQCDQSMIARWEKGECEPTESIIRKTARFFEVTADYLIGLEDESGTKI